MIVIPNTFNTKRILQLAYVALSQTQNEYKSDTCSNTKYNKYNITDPNRKIGKICHTGPFASHYHTFRLNTQHTTKILQLA